jgi:hypothetical protein
MEIWQFKIRLHRKKVKGWARNVNVELRKLKNDLLKEYEVLDIRYETETLLPGQKTRMDNILGELESILNMEEMKARQRSRERRVKEGDRNTAYFQAVANQRNRKQRISCFETTEGLIEDNELMLNHDVDFYKKLFEAEPDSGVKLDENFWEEEDKITILENSLLEAPFTEQEIRIAVFDSYSDGAPSPDGFSFMFYQSFWDLIKDDFMKLVK